MTMIRAVTLAIAALTVLGASAAASPEQLRLKLKPQVVVTGDIVRIGDLVENAGIASKVPIFRAPDLGSTGTVSADAVIEAVRAYALVGLDTGNIAEVVVTHASRTIPAKTVEASIAQALSAQYRLGPSKDITVNFDRELRDIQVEVDAIGDPRVTHISFNGHSGRFAAALDIPVGNGSRSAFRLSGNAAATAEVVSVARPIDRGEILKSPDVLIERRPRAQVGPDILTDRDQAIGLAARNTLQPGRPIHVADLTKPPLVQRNETVSLVYQVPGIKLTARGKASESGAEGDVISVLNEQSKRTVQGVVVGPGRVVISTGSPRLAANIAPARPVTTTNNR
jgi:flagellar basal body P-ring formation protein FlgA